MKNQTTETPRVEEAKVTALAIYFVSVESEFHIYEASRTYGTLRRLTIGLHLFTYTSRISS